MNSIKKLLIVSAVACFIIVFFARHTLFSFWHKKEGAYTIGIIQTASHPALDKAAQGFKDYFTTHHPGGVFMSRNVQADVAQAHSIAKSFNNRSSIDALFAIGTLTAQACVQTQRQKPLAIAAVSDPEHHGIWKPNGLVCGSSDSVDAGVQFACIKKIYHPLRTLGILYSVYEPNASLAAKNMKSVAESEGLTVKQYGISQPADVPLVVQRITGCDVVWCPTDNTVAISLQSIINYLASSQALIISDNLLMTRGVYASIGVDYYQAGQQAAQCLSDVLFKAGKSYSIIYPTISTILISKSLALRYNPSLLEHHNDTLVWTD